MTLSEFKAWLEGFSEAFNGKAPNQKQWAKIQERLGQVDVQETIQIQPIYPLREIRPWWPNTWITWTGYSNGTEGVTISNCANSVGKYEAQLLAMKS